MHIPLNRSLIYSTNAIALITAFYSGAAGASGSVGGEGLGTMLVGILGLVAGFITATYACVTRLSTTRALTILPIVFFAVMCVVPFLFYSVGGLSNAFAGTIEFFHDSFRTFEAAAQTMLVATIGSVITFAPVKILCAVIRN